MLVCGGMCLRAFVTVLCSIALLCAGTARAYDDAGASTFESGERLYREKTWTLDEIPVPARPVVLKPAAEGGVTAPSGPVFAIKHFDVVGNTLLSTQVVEQTLAPYVDPKATFTTIEKARDALQQRYSSEGFIAVAVGVPQQTVESGSVRLDVTEARIGEVNVQNTGVAWVSEEKVREMAPHIQPGALLRESDLREDLARLNANPDRRVRPVLAPSKQPGYVDVNLVVDDQIPLHGSVTLNNERTPGSPHSRLITNMSYTDLWDLEHALSLTYITAPTQSNDVLIGSASYSAPNPWRESDLLLGYWAYSDTFSTVPLVAGLGSIGKGQSFGFRYNAALPDLLHSEDFSFRQGLIAGVDYKDIKSTLQETGSPDETKTPIRYLPFAVTWWTNYTGSDNYAAFSLADRFNFSGMVEGGSKEDFQANRGGVSPDNPVNGNYQIFAWTFEYRHRLSMADGASFLANLSESVLGPLWPHTGVPRDSISLFDDWSFVMRSEGQIATQPLIPTEQYAAGGVTNVRGYLQSEVFGDNAYFYSAELWARHYSIDLGLGPPWTLGLRPTAFWDYACMYNKDPGEGEPGKTCIYSLGTGLQLFFTPWLSGDLFLADPLATTTSTTAGNVRLHFRLSGGF